MDRNKPLPRIHAVLRCLAGRTVLFIHTKSLGRREIADGRYGFMNGLIRLAASRGVPFAFLPFGRGPYLARCGRPAIHLYSTFGEAPKGDRVLVASPGYVNDYWYLDRLGHRGSPTIAAREYDPASIDPQAANALFKTLRRRFVRHGETSRPQPGRDADAVPDASIAIILQFHKDNERPKGALCSEIEMIRAIVAARRARPVVIKCHPHGVDAEVRAEIDRLCAGEANVTCIEANIHDILANASAVCTYNSAAGFEAMLHRKPVLLFADADYHHGAVQVHDLADVPELLASAEAKKFNYPKYVYWFLQHNLFHPDQADFEARVLDVLGEWLPEAR